MEDWVTYEEDDNMYEEEVVAPSLEDNIVLKIILLRPWTPLCRTL